MTIGRLKVVQTLGSVWTRRQSQMEGSAIFFYLSDFKLKAKLDLKFEESNAPARKAAVNE